MSKTRSPYLSSEAAAAELGVRRETLYAYVSRGLLRSEKREGRRSRWYRREDVERLKRRGEEKRRPERMLETALHFGGPVLESAITWIDAGRIFYRGQDAFALARTSTFEAVATLVWGVGGGDPFRGLPTELPEGVRAVEQALGRTLDHPERLQALLPSLAAGDPGSWDLRPEAVARSGARLLSQLTSLVAGVPWRGGAVQTLAHGWGLPDAEEAREPRLLTAALVCCVDHELNVSAFTARCVASAGSPIHMVVAAALSALQGPEHGGHIRRVEALLREIDDVGSPRRVLADRLRRGEAVPGFGHPVYPGGDPRCRTLLDLVTEGWPGDPHVNLALDLRAAGQELLGEHPTVDLALALTARVLGLPRHAAMTLFALGRTAGWIGHALEQYARGQLIRPRARYVGDPPLGGQAEG
ncbi:MAG: citrate/2-methylcitrate synthase [Acidobacteriota bacterium]